jgi:hypothetical protein
VRRYISVLRDADAASERLGTYGTRQPLQESHPHAYDRVGQAAVLYTAEKQILEEGFQGRELPIDPMRGTSLPRTLTDAIEPFGLRVDVTEEWERRWYGDPLTWGEFPDPEPVGGIWVGRSEYGPRDPWVRVDGEKRFWDLPDWPNERHDREHMRALAAEASVQGVDPARPRTDPVMHTLLTGIVYGRELVRATEDLDGLQPAPEMTPPAQERLRRVAPLNRLAVGVLEDAVRPGSMTQERVIVELTPVLEAYDLRFVA